SPRHEPKRNATAPFPPQRRVRLGQAMPSHATGGDVLSKPRRRLCPPRSGTRLPPMVARRRQGVPRGNLRRRMHIAIDLKNLALHSGGIAAFGRPLVAAWLAHRPEYRFSLVGPRFDTAAFAGLSNWNLTDVPWPARLPRSLRHPVYDTLLFPRTIAKL